MSVPAGLSVPPIQRLRAVWGVAAGLVSSVALVVLSPAVWKGVLGHPAAIFPYDHPALFTVPFAFLVTYLCSRFDNSARAHAEREGFDARLVQAQTGHGAAAASNH